MPWTARDALRRSRKATSPTAKKLWAEVANATLERTGDEGRAVREANAVVGRYKRNRAGRDHQSAKAHRS